MLLKVLKNILALSFFCSLGLETNAGVAICGDLLNNQMSLFFTEGRRLKEPITNLMSQGPVGFFEGSHVVTFNQRFGLKETVQIGALFVNPTVEEAVNRALQGLPADFIATRLLGGVNTFSPSAKLYVAGQLAQTSSGEWIFEIEGITAKEVQGPSAEGAEIIQLFPGTK